MAKLLIFGNGVLGGQVLDLLAMYPTPFDSIVVASRNERQIVERTNLSRFAGIDMGRHPRILTRQVDIRNIDATATLLAEEEPDLVFQSACIWSWWKIRTLPEPIFRELDSAAVGPWLPLYLALTMNVMKAMAMAGVTCPVVNGCYPDATNAVLATIDAAPVCGIGNLARSVSILRAAIADHLKMPTTRISVRFYAQHYVGYQLLQSSAPERLPKIIRVLVDGADRTQEVPLDAIVRNIPAHYPRVRGMAGQLLTATSAFKILTALQSESPSLEHAPGPLGKIGGYPCWISKAGIRLLLDDIDPKQADDVNRLGQSLEGVSQIGPKGFMSFEAENMSILTKYIGYQATTLQIEDVWPAATELLERFAAFSKLHPVRSVS